MIWETFLKDVVRVRCQDEPVSAQNIVLTKDPAVSQCVGPVRTNIVRLEPAE